jgi:hypothetical protein
VDNSRNIEKEEAAGATLIPNKNLGGAGGFTRGLLHLKDQGSFTHCLFMDDDASCEIESLCRAYSILSYATTPQLAIAGSLLRELEPYRLFEKGARFDGFCRPLKTGMDMRNVNDLLLAERKDVEADYGAWWFFAFAIKHVREFAFPFFVRGDDVGFGLANKFKIITMNGISCWGDDFGLKSGPMTAYLDLRNHLINSMHHCGKSASQTLAIARKFVMNQLYSYNYASARAINLAMRHVMQGPDFFLNNMDMADVRKEIASFSDTEKMQPIDRSDHKPVYKMSRIIKKRTIVQKITLNGFLLPKFMIRKKTIFHAKSFHVNPQQVYRYNQILHLYEPLEVGYLAKYDKKLFFKELQIFMLNSLKWIISFDKIRNKYNSSWDKMTNESFWRNIYK